MRIAQVTHLFPPATGGIEKHVYEICRQLVKSGDNVTVFTTSFGNAPKEETMEGFEVRRFFSLNLPVFSSVRFPPMLFFSLLRENFDVYCSHGYGSLMPFITSIAALIKRKPFVFTVHGYPRLKGLSGIFQKLYGIFFASIYLRIAKRIIVVSQNSIADISKEVDARKLVYIPNGISADEFSCDTFRGRNTITYVGRLDEYKGVNVLIRAFARIHATNPELKLRIVGRDEGIKKGLEALADEQKVKVEFLDLPYSEMKRIYCESLAVVLPSRYEGFSLVWLEAIASKRPMFSTPVGDASILFDDVYGKHAEKFLFENEKELAERVIFFYQNQDSFEKIISSAERLCKEKYSWANVATRTRKIYASSTA